MNELANDEETTILNARDLEEKIFKRIALKVRDENAKLLRSIAPINATNTWSCLGSGSIATDGPSDDDPSTFQLSEDLYAILATASWRTFPFWFSILVIFGFQYLLVILLLANTLEVKNSDNPLNLPPNVEPSVRTSQMMLIVIALFSQGDMLAGIESLVRGLPDHFRGDERFASMTRLQWRLSSLVRFTEGLLNLLACFVLAIQAETVSDVLLNVLGVTFISDLDEVAFRLCLKGYFGGSMKVMSTDVRAVQFHRFTPNIRASVLMVRRKIKEDGHILSAFGVLLLAMIAFGYLAYEQYSGKYLKQNIRIEFGDEVLPFLGLFNGCYLTTLSSNHIDGRLVYEQVGYPEGGKFGFCADFEGEGGKGWVFFIGTKEEEDDICKKENYILRSGETETFSLLEAGKTKWYTNDDLPMDYLEITETKSSTAECGQSMFKDSKDTCPSILAFDTMIMTKLVPPANVDTNSENGLDAAVSHPIYFSQNSGTENGSFTLAFFTGRRWISTESDHIIGLGSETNVDDIKSFFFSKNGLFTIINHLRTSAVVDEEVDGVSAVSEIVDMTRDQGLPLGLHWYFPRYKETNDATEKGNLVRNFPSANLARQRDPVWTCEFCYSATNPCLYGGICDEDSRVCTSCKHGTSGNLCQVLPTGNGICNLYFNTAAFNYDGGDCCAGTCKGRDCGKDDLSDPFPSTYVDWDIMLDHFQTTTGEWDDPFRGQEFAYSVPISEESLYFGQPFPLRFSHCIDPNTALLTIEQKPSPSYSGMGEMGLARTKVLCDGLLYLRTPVFQIDYRSNYILKEEVRVPYGARCKFWFENFMSDYNVSIFAENQSVPFLQKQFEINIHHSVILRIPESDCVWSAFATYLIPPAFTASEFYEFDGGVDLQRMCERDPAELLERYTLWKLFKSAAAVGLQLVRNFDGHICDLPWKSWHLFCSDDSSSSRRVDQFNVAWFGNELLSEIGAFGQLTHLQAKSCNNLTSLPTGIESLASLGSLDLVGNKLNSLPSEIGSLTSLYWIDLAGNNLNYLPSEIGSLASLIQLTLMDNQLISLPSEIENLASSLTGLDLEGNKLNYLLPEIGSLTSLTVLDLRENKLTRIPTEMGLLKSLSSLFIQRNKLTRIPSEIGNLRSLTRLDLYFNPMTANSLPIEVQGLEDGELDIIICRPFDGESENGCLDYTCNDDSSWGYVGISGTATHDCETYNSYGYCPIDDTWDGDYVDSDVSGRNNACCICGGGNLEFTAIWPYDNENDDYYYGDAYDHYEDDDDLLAGCDW